MQTAEIKEIRRTSSENEANALLEQGWRILNITANGLRYTYLLAKY